MLDRPKADPVRKDTAPAEGWWKASDGKWYPPDQAGTAAGWWQASDGKWYPPEARATNVAIATRPPRPEPVAAPAATLGSAITQGARPAVTEIGPLLPVPAPPRAPVPPLAAAPAAPTRASDATPPATTPATAPTPVARKAAVVKKASVKKAAVVKPATKASATKPSTVKAPTANTQAAKPAAAKSPAGAANDGPSKRSSDLDIGGVPGLAPSPDVQILQRNQSSAADAAFLATARANAATRALGTLQAQIEEELAKSGRGSVTADTPTAKPPAATTAAAKSAAPGARPAAAAASRDGDATKTADEGATIERGGRSSSGRDTVLMSVKPSPVAQDLDRLGDHLVILDDRVELRDRNDKPRRVILGDHIADVVIAKKLTGAMITVESGDGDTIQLKGLRPDQAEEIKALIMRRTRRKGPAPQREAGVGVSEGAAPRTTRTSRPRLPASIADDLVSKLEDLHRAGILTDAELAEKKALVARAQAGEQLAPQPS